MIGFLLFFLENGFVVLFFKRRTNFSLKDLLGDRLELPSAFQPQFPLSQHICMVCIKNVNLPTI